MNVQAMIDRYRLIPRGVIQVGSHHGEEQTIWEELKIKIAHFEPILSNVAKLHERISTYTMVFPLALGNKTGVFEMYTETVNGGQSCSVLKPKEHLDLLPWIEFNGKEEVPMVRLDDLPENWSGFNFMYVDVQGYELEVFMGGKETIRNFDFIFTEVNRAEVYESCARIEDVDYFLGSIGFDRVETEWHGGKFGDALYVKHALL